MFLVIVEVPVTPVPGSTGDTSMTVAEMNTTTTNNNPGTISFSLASYIL